MRKTLAFDYEVCGLDFETENNLKKHKEFVHKEGVPFDCEHCVLDFETEKDLKNHIESEECLLIANTVV